MWRQQLTFSISAYIKFLSALLKQSLKFSVSSIKLYHKNWLCVEHLDFFEVFSLCIQCRLAWNIRNLSGTALRSIRLNLYMVLLEQKYCSQKLICSTWFVEQNLICSTQVLRCKCLCDKLFELDTMALHTSLFYMVRWYTRTIPLLFIVGKVIKWGFPSGKRLENIAKPGNWT